MIKSVYQKFLKKAEKEKAMAEIQNQIEEIFQKNEREYNVKVNIVNAFVLNQTFGFGKKRLEEYVVACSQIQKQMLARYDDADLYAMEKKLKDAGIDIRAWVEREYDNPDRGFTTIEV